MSGLLIMIGGACIGAAFFGKSSLGEKQIPVLLVGMLILSIGMHLSRDPDDCGTGWDGRGSYSDC